MSVTVGDTKHNNKGSVMVIKEIRNSKDMDIYFPEYDHTEYHKQQTEFIKGTIRSPYCTSLFGFANGRKKICQEEKHAYLTWKRMLTRCVLNTHSAYGDVKISKEWWIFDDFKDWYDKNYYSIENEKMCLDKDLLTNNREYSSENCCFLPQRINNFLTNKKRKHEETGVHVRKKTGYLQVSSKDITGKQKTIGTFKTIEEARIAYKTHREKIAKELAELYKDKVPANVYNALKNYKEI